MSGCWVIGRGWVGRRIAACPSPTCAVLLGRQRQTPQPLPARPNTPASRTSKPVTPVSPLT
jgi:hypothetical protein